ncbi:flagellar assembly peptidoglycan hydrolase FlgJ [Niveibacterium sp. SC-1]|uniref:flagellar assembly peptidoglycan hydrolase FlgJ n=1 Tax=Niveibacterium sp. SC-1 TaxID=3135646 RepID=UPI003120015B
MQLPAQDSIFDMGGFNRLRQLQDQKSPEAIKAVAQQFEALFVQMVVKQMRQSTSFGAPGFDGEQAGFFRGLSDQQLSLNLSKAGGFGLAKSIERQLSKAQGVDMSEESGSTAGDLAKHPIFWPTRSPQAATPTTSAAPTQASASANGFVDKIWDAASRAAQDLDVPAHFLVGHAALETGWGKGEIRKADGSPSYNLFNIKAGADWKGAVAEASTVEYENGTAVRKVERFRAYANYDEAFADYARLLQNSPRYATVSGQQSADGFARALAQGGYATDPMYAGKLARVIGGNTLRTALAS